MKAVLFFLLLFFAVPFVSGQNKTAAELRTLADQYYDAEKYAESIPYFLKIIEKDHRDHEALQLLGIAYSKTGNSEKAKQYLRLAILYSENKSYYYSSLSGVYNDLNEFDKGYEYARKSLEIDENTQSLFNAASLANNAGKTSQCISILDKSTIALHNDFNSLYGRCYLQLGNYTQAIRHYELFFADYNASDKFAEVNIKHEEKNLLRSYFSGVVSKKSSEEEKKKYIAKIQNSPEESYTDLRNEFFFQEINICPGLNYNNSQCSALFSKVFPKYLSDEDRVKFNYYVQKDDKEALRLADQIITNSPEDSVDYELQMLRYRACLRMFLSDYKANNKQPNLKLLDRASLFFAQFYDDGMDYTFVEIDANEQYSMPLAETFIILKEDFPLMSQRKELNSYIYHIIKNIPSSELRAKMKAELENTD